MHTGMNPPLCPALLFGADSKGGHKISLKPVPCPVWIYYCTGGHMARDRLHPLMLKELDCADSILSSPCLSMASPVSLHCCSCWQLGWWLLCSSETPPCTTPQREWAANTVRWSHSRTGESLHGPQEATGGQWDVVRGLHNLLPRWCGGLWIWQELKSSLWLQLLTSGDGSSRWLLCILWTSSITDQIFHWNGVCLLQIPPFLGTVKAKKKRRILKQGRF